MSDTPNHSAAAQTPLALASTDEIQLELLLRALGRRQRTIGEFEITLLRLREKQAAGELEFARIQTRIAAAVRI